MYLKSEEISILCLYTNTNVTTVENRSSKLFAFQSQDQLQPARSARLRIHIRRSQRQHRLDQLLLVHSLPEEAVNRVVDLLERGNRFSAVGRTERIFSDED